MKYFKHLIGILFISSIAYSAADRLVEANKFRLNEASPGTNKIIITAPSFSSDYTLTLPVSAGTSNAVLGTNGSGVLSWIPGGGGGSGTITGPATTVSGAVAYFSNTTGTQLAEYTSLPLSRGGTANNISAIAGGFLYSTATAISVTAQGTSGDIAMSQGSAAPIWKTWFATQGTRQTGTSMSASTAITAVVGVNNTIYVVGNGGAVVITATTPFVTTSMTVGQEMKVCGTSDTNTVTWNNGNNLVLTGSATVGKDQCFGLIYSGSDGSNSAWVESWRNF